MKPRRWPFWAVALGTAACFLPVLWAGWSGLGSDSAPAGAASLSWEAIRNLLDFQPGRLYEPLTRFLRLLEARAWGVHPTGSHAVGALLHVINALVLFAVLRRLLAEGRAARAHGASASACAAFGALVFSLHPSRVEPVAWSDCRGTLLSSFFLLLSLYAFLRRKQEPTRAGAWLAASAASYGVALLAQSVLWTFPLILLLLDRHIPDAPAASPADPAEIPPYWAARLPFFALGVSAMAFLLHALYLDPMHGVFPRTGRAWELARALAVLLYPIERALVPLHLAPFHPAAPSAPFAAAAALRACGLAAVTWLLLSRRSGMARAGASLWGVYLAAAFPFIAVGSGAGTAFQSQWVDDRWAYLPSMALGAGASFALQAWGDRFTRRARMAALAAGGLAALLAVAALSQERLWLEPERLMERNLAVEPECYACRWALASQLEMRNDGAAAKEQRRLARETLSRWLAPPLYGKDDGDLVYRLGGGTGPEESIVWSQVALGLDPGMCRAYLNLGFLLGQRGRLDEAIEASRAALRCDPSVLNARINLGFFLQQRGHWKEAAEQLRAVLERQPNNSLAANNLRAALASGPCGGTDPVGRHLNEGLRLSRENKLDEAIERTRSALECEPDSAGAHNNLGWFLQLKGRHREALAQYQAALVRNPLDNLAAGNLRSVVSALGLCRAPGEASAALNRGLEASRKGRLDEAIRETQAALACDPRMVGAYNNLGFFYRQKGRLKEAIAHFKAALVLDPGNRLAANNLRAATEDLGR